MNTTPAKPWVKESVADVVEQHMSDIDYKGITFHVLKDETDFDGYFWNVPVEPSVAFRFRYALHDILATVEQEILAEEGVRVLLIPAENGVPERVNPA